MNGKIKVPPTVQAFAIGVDGIRRRETTIDVMILLQCYADLLEVILALSAPRRLASSMDNRKQHCNRDDYHSSRDRDLQQNNFQFHFGDSGLFSG